MSEKGAKAILNTGCTNFTECEASLMQIFSMLVRSVQCISLHHLTFKRAQFSVAHNFAYFSSFRIGFTASSPFPITETVLLFLQKDLIARSAKASGCNPK